ncbi:DUF2795 domain-containing protein [Streptomyces sp. NPDC050560]|uniref:DUF2795 domain-containing protein n=1 Tax=Streptomyces sp. NPDC050560 TaxID=3365630 RepID=UPI0037AFE8D6
MQRGSDRLSVHRDDEMKAELRGLLNSGRPTRTEEWHDPEPTADDDPELAGGPVIPGPGSRGSVPELRYELARHLGRAPFPAGRDRLRVALRQQHAPDGLVDLMDELPRGTTYHTARELAEALLSAGGEP